MIDHTLDVAGPSDAPATLDYQAPSSLAELVHLLAKRGDDAKILGGGQSLLVLVRMGLISPALLIGLRRIEVLRELNSLPGGGFRIGAMVTQHRLEHAPLIRRHYTALAEAAAVVASPAVRRQGTLGGNLAHADPTADPPAALIALGASVEIASSTGIRREPVELLFRDYMETTLGSAEVITAIELPEPAAHSGSAYVKHRLRGVDTALAGAAVRLTLDDDKQHCTSVSIGLSGAGVTPLRAATAETLLTGRIIDSSTISAAAAVAAGESSPFADTEASEWYRREMIQVVTRRALTSAWQRARNGGRE